MTSEVDLPKGKVKATSISPEVLVIYSKPKVGKTTALSLLEDSLILDFEKGTNWLDACKLQVESLSHLKRIGDKVLAEGKPYKYIVVDTVTALEDMCMPLAVDLYKETPMGKGYTGKNILTLPQGAGYLYLRMAMEKILNYIKTLAPRVVFLGHMRDKTLTNPDGKEVNAADIDLTGKIRNILCAEASAIAIMTRKDNQVFLNFKNNDSVICGARPKHLKDQEIIITEETPEGIKAYWDKVYID